MSKHNRERRKVRAENKAAMLATMKAKGIKPAGKTKDTTRVIYKDTEAGPSRHRETKHNPPWWITPKEPLTATVSSL